MASQPKNAAPVVDQVIELDPATIDVTGRVGLFYPEKAEAYAALIARDGQRTPIVVRSNGNRAKLPWTLVAGLHRHAACTMAAMPIRAIVVEGDADELRAIQASENLDRRELAPLERAMFVAAVADAAKRRLQTLHGGKSQQQIAAEIGASERAVKMTERSDSKIDKVQFTPVEKADTEAAAAGKTLSSTYRWSDATAAACGMGVESLKRSLRIYRIIVEPNRDLMDALKNHAVAGNASALLAICGKGNDPATVRAILEWLIAHPEAKTADEAIVALELAPSKGGSAAPAPDAKRLSAFIGTFGRMPLAEKKGALGQLGQMLPAGFEIVEAGSRPAQPHLEAQAKQLRTALQIADNLIGKLRAGIGVEDEEIEDADAVVSAALRAAAVGLSGVDLSKGEKE
ncbi:MAG: ParB N-terminal domain-containing protein [Sphingopyxis granuli]|uniref:ParB/RepB/Spo0J family partition protein n=1 Tax=Sphingopyxis granuli TaxID=267128 RepID=UPI003C7219E9